MQAVHMKKSISECDDKSIVLRVDFSENTSLLTQKKFDQLTGTIVKQQSSQHMHGLMRIRVKTLPLYQIIEPH